MVLVENPTLNKSLLAKHMAISRDSLYEQFKLQARDAAFKLVVENLLVKEPYYGHRRLAWYLGCNPKKTLRIMRKCNLECRFRRKKFKYVKQTDKVTIPNTLLNQKPVKPNEFWSTDFTYINYRGKFIYLAVQKDLFTKEAVGVSVKTKHNEELVVEATSVALKTNEAPKKSHSDQGAEYNSFGYQDLLKKYNIESSMSNKGSPWENGYSEGFFSRFKLEFGNPSRFENEQELISAIYRWIKYYNNERIHSALKTSPAKFKHSWLSQNF